MWKHGPRPDVYLWSGSWTDYHGANVPPAFRKSREAVWNVSAKRGNCTGSDTDLLVWNTETEWVLSAENQTANVDYQAYEGYPVKGIAEQVYVNGQLAAENGKIAKGTSGQYVKREVLYKAFLKHTVPFLSKL